MRTILLNERGEFKKKGKTDYVRGAAVKMMASMVAKIEYKNDKEVIVAKNNMEKRDDPEKT